MQGDAQEYAKVEIGSSRSFAMVFAAVFTLIGCYPMLSGEDPIIWSLSVAAVFFVTGVIYPRALQPLNRIWFMFGMLLGRIVNPLVMFVIYVVAMLPIGLLLKLLGKDLLRLRIEDADNSYWIVREPPGPEPASLENQF